MSYNSNLQSKNNVLQSILNTINELPEAGGDIEQATPVISVNASGLITATAGTKTATKQLAFQPAKTITPSTTNQIAISSGYYTGGDITVKGDSNLKPENIKSGVSIFGINGTASGGGSGDTSMEDALVTGEISVYTNDRVKSIGNYAFYRCSSLTSVSFPVCSYIGGNAFYDCSRLTSVSFPVCSYIGSSAFNYCSRLTSVSFPVCSYIGSNAFYNCYRLTSVSFPVCSYIGSSAFNYCSSLTSVSFPVCSYIGGNAFQYCYSLTSVSFPVCSSIGSSAFYSCYSLTSVSFPVCSYIGSSAFNKCARLSQVYLMNSVVCTLSNSNAFNSTPFKGYSSYFSGTPSIFVPTSLVDAYKSATNWTYFSSYIVGI